MRNAVYEYDTFLRKNKLVRDFSSIYFNNLQQLFEEHSEYFTTIDLSEDERLENVAYQLYGDENIADLLLAINDENFIWSSPLNQDILLEQSKIVLKEYAENLNIHNFNENLSYLELQEKINQYIDDSNSKRKKFKVPKADYLGEVINLVNNYKTAYTENTQTVNEIE